MPTPGEIEVFKWAMRAVYGLFDTLTEVEAQLWIPPTNPGARVPKGRHLWTDAFGVVNFITLAKETASPIYLVLAKRLVHAVHNVLGKTPDGSARLYPATDEEPLKGGLRIGQLESDGPDDDGQVPTNPTAVRGGAYADTVNRSTIIRSSSGYLHSTVSPLRLVRLVTTDLQFSLQRRFFLPLSSGTRRLTLADCALHGRYLSIGSGSWYPRKVITMQQRDMWSYGSFNRPPNILTVHGESSAGR
jgi:hypothetical protein